MQLEQVADHVSNTHCIVQYISLYFPVNLLNVKYIINMPTNARHIVDTTGGSLIHTILIQ